ncbi:hypothetical protein ES705_38726 [subsurface metagenome]
MNAVKGFYHDGIVELIDDPKIQGPADVLIIFPDKDKKVRKIRGLLKDCNISYNDIENDLKSLNRISELHILDEVDNKDG